ncbi:hypothetical protein [Bacillus sp. S/N-304-OC-R1]|uniref:hypothetical protein n=1 Tax=Bacillus sp. S/N-304-OC-R1 TaxID=2758034 RepID=UPI001C8DC10B|nr:hypothetical protein [Bacillus sp. S/N-304-OC-R1]MBY0124502.1 hypothetical protein [Bacillus sp. S/N-304-OC-R1]
MYDDLSLYKRCASCHKEFSPFDGKTIINSSEFYSYVVCNSCIPKERPKEELPHRDLNKCAGCEKEFTSDSQKHTITKGNDQFNLCYKCCRG